MAVRSRAGGRRRPMFSIPARGAGVYLAIAWALLAAGLSLPAFGPLVEAVPGLAGAWAGIPVFSWNSLARALTGHLWAVFAPAAILRAAWGVGGPVAGMLRAGPPRRGGNSPALTRADRGIDRMLLRPVLGLGLISLAVQGLGYPGLHFRGLLLALGILAATLGGWSLWREKPWRIFRSGVLSGSRIALPVLGVVLLGAFLLARLPDTAEDARLYHLAAPENYIFLHKIVAEPGHFEWHMPLGAEMLFLPPYAIGGTGFAKQVNVAVFALLLGMTGRLAVALGAGGWLAAVIAGTAGLSLGQCWEVKNDLLVALYVSSSALLIVLGLAGKRRLFLPAAFLAGLALGVKFTAGLAVAGLAAGIIVVEGRRLRRFRWPVLLSTGLAPFIGWLVSSWLFLGNPFHPFLSGIFSDLGWGPFYMEGLNGQARAISPESVQSAWDWLGGAWRAFGSWDLGSAVIFWSLPAVLLVRRGRGAAALGVGAAAAYLMWLPSNRNVRYLFCLVPLVSALAAGVPPRTGFFSGWTARLRAILVAFSLAVAVVVGARQIGPAGLVFLLGQSTRESLLASRYSTWEDMRLWVNGNVPAGGRILFNGEERRLWFSRRVISNGPVFEPFFWKATRECSNAGQVRKRLRQAGITHLVHEFLSSQFRRLIWFAGPDWDIRQLHLYEKFISGYGELIRTPPHVDIDNGGFYVYRFRKGPVVDPGPAWFLPSTEGRWLQSYAMRNDPVASRISAELDLGPMRGVFQVRFVMATLTARADDWAEALRLMRPGAEAGFIDNGSWNYYGIALFKAGDLDGGIRALGKALLLQGDASSRKQLAGLFLARMKKRIGAGDKAGAARDKQAARFVLGQ